jgi:hypothetical protein
MDGDCPQMTFAHPFLFFPEPVAILAVDSHLVIVDNLSEQPGPPLYLGR